MTYPGYRNTAPARVFISFDKDKVSDNSILTGGYDDPFDLSNSFLSFKYYPTDVNQLKSSLYKVVLVNLNEELEKSIFSRYYAAFPRAWKSQDVDITDDELKERISNIDNVYIRWGYVSNDDDEDKIIALSHTHKCKLIEVNYNISDNNERLVSLYFVNTLDYSFRALSEINQVDKRRISVDLLQRSSKNKLRRVSDVVQELVLQCFNVAEGYTLLGKLSEEQKTAIDSYFDKAVEARMERLNLSGVEFSHAGYEFNFSKWAPYAKSRSKKIIQDVAVEYVLDEFFTKILGGNLKVIEDKPSDKNLGTVPALGPNSSARIQSPLLPFNAGHPYDQIQSAHVSEDGYFEWVFLENEWDYNQLSNPSGSVPFSTNGYYLAAPVGDGTYTTRIPVSYVEDILFSGKHFFLVSPQVKQLLDLRVLDKYEQWPRLAGPDTEYFLPHSNSFGLSSSPTVTSWNSKIQAYRSRQFSKSYHDSTDGYWARDYEYEARQAYEELKDSVPDDEDNQQPLFVSGTDFINLKVTFKSDESLLVAANNYLTRINEVILQNSSYEGMQVAVLESSVVPEQDRDSITEILGLDEDFDWDNTNGIVFVGSKTLINKVFSFSRKIKSFPIEVSNNDSISRISISTGFSNRKDNIITSLNFKLNNSAFFYSLRKSPIFVQSLYSIAKRFEDESFRDNVIRILEYSFTTNQIEKLNETDDKIIRVTIPGAFPEDAIKNAPGLVRKLSEVDSSELPDSDPGGEGIHLTKDNHLYLALQDDLAEDFSKIFESPLLLDVFFPKVRDSLGTVVNDLNFDAVSNVLEIDGEENIIASLPVFRTVSASPLHILQEKMRVDNVEDAVGLATLMDSLLEAKATMANVKVSLLGVPEMDIFDNELSRRHVHLWVTEPRDPGRFHWITGNYFITEFNHVIDSSGFQTNLTMMAKPANTAEEMLDAHLALTEFND